MNGKQAEGVFLGLSLQRLSMMAFVISVSLLTLWAYWPSLGHVPTHDQFAYLSSMADKDDFSSLAFGAYAYNRTILQNSGDNLLFRPLLYFILGCEKYFFGYNFSLWQLTGILMHLLVTILLSCLLWTLNPGWPALIFSAYFSLLLVNVTMVNWANVHGYMLFGAIMLLVLKELFLLNEEGGDNSARIKRSALWMSIGVFLYETGIFFAFLMFLYLLVVVKGKRIKKWAWLMMIPVVLYSVLSLGDLYFIHPITRGEPGNIIGQIFNLATVSNSIRVFKWLVCCGIFLNPSDMGEVFRTVIFPYTYSWHWPLDKLSPTFFRGTLGIVICGIILTIGLHKEMLSKRKLFMLLLVGCIMSYILVIVSGRLNSRGVEAGLCFNAYYFYLFWLLLIPFLYSAVDFFRCRTWPSWGALKFITVVLVVAISFNNLMGLRNVNETIAKSHSQRRAFLVYIDKFVEQHKNEPDFSFSIDTFCPGNYPEFLPKEINPKWKKYTYADFYYPKYSRRVGAKYSVPCPFMN